MNSQYAIFKGNKKIGEYDGLHVELLFMEYAEKWLKKNPKDRDCLYIQCTSKYMDKNNLRIEKI